MTGEAGTPSPPSSAQWAPPPGSPANPPPEQPTSTAAATPSTFDGWVIVTHTSIGSLPAGSAAFIRNLDGRLVLQGRVTDKNTEPPVLLDTPAGRWSWQQEQVTWVERTTPGWAIAVGIVGLLFFLIGIVFFFVKTDVTKTGSGVRVDTPEGTVVARYQGRP